MTVVCNCLAQRFWNPHEWLREFVYFNKRSVSNVFIVDVLKKKMRCKLAFLKNFELDINVTTKTLLLLKNHSTPH